MQRCPGGGAAPAAGHCILICNKKPAEPFDWLCGLFPAMGGGKIAVTAKESGGKIVFAGEKMTAATLCGRTGPHLLAVKEKDKCRKADFIA